MRDKCEICGEPLEYATQIDKYINLKCAFCKKEDSVNIYCPNGHYICDECHAKGSIEVIEEFCESTDINDPFIIADNIMKHPKFKLYGPEHHALVPAAILTALKNNKIKKPNGQEITLMDIKEGIRRGSKIPGGWCGFYGCCGAGMGSGIAISIFMNATPSTDKPRTMANQMTSRCLNKIADDLEHCCKRSVRISIIESLIFLKNNFQIDLNFKPQKCSFAKINDKCETKDCFLFCE